jgi:hypothetical protein
MGRGWEPATHGGGHDKRREHKSRALHDSRRVGFRSVRDDIAVRYDYCHSIAACIHLSSGRTRFSENSCRVKSSFGRGNHGFLCALIPMRVLVRSRNFLSFMLNAGV